MEFERVADYKPADIDRLEKMPIHNYLLHILALKRRADELQKPDSEDDFN